MALGHQGTAFRMQLKFARGLSPLSVPDNCIGSPRLGSKKLPLWPHVFMALFGAGWAVAFDAGVRIYSAEVIVIAGLVVLPWWKVLHRYPMARAAIGALGLWVVAIGIADFINDTDFFDFARNLATPILGSASMLCVLAALSRNPYALLSFLAATAIAKGVLGEPLYGDDFADMPLSLASVAQDSNFFKVRIDPFLTPSILLLACFVSRKGFIYAAVIFIAAAIGYFLVDARSSGLVFFLAAMALIAIHFHFRPKFGQMIAAGVVVAAIGFGAYAAYANYTLTNSPSGHNGKQMARMENPYNPIELLLQGRSEWLVMGTVIAERPLFGWGSWAVDKDYRFAYLRTERTGVYEYASIDSARASLYIPAHSVVGSAWVWSGLLGAIAMAWLFRSIARMSLVLLSVKSNLVPAAVFLALMMIWHFFFSPPQSVRLFFPVGLAALIAMTANVQVRPRRKGVLPVATIRNRGGAGLK